MNIDHRLFMTLPASHGNIGHALDAVCACWEYRPQRLVLELPHELQPLAPQITAAVQILGATPGAAFIPRQSVRMPVPVASNPEEVEVRDVLMGDCIPIGADSITIPLWMTGHIPGWRPRVVFADGMAADTPECIAGAGSIDFAHMDTAEVEQIGTTEFYAKWKDFIDKHVCQSAASVQRESCMAWHAREAQWSGETTLMVNGAAHEERIRSRLLANEIPETIESAPARMSDLRVFAVPPAAAFASLNWMQDAPHITASFWKNILAGQFLFDRGAAELAVLVDAYERAGRPFSSRQMANIVRAIRKTLATDGHYRVPMDVLAERISAFAGMGFADFLVNEVFLDYPIQRTGKVPEVDVLPVHPLGHFLFNFEQDEVYLLPDPPGRQEKRAGMRRWVRRQRLRGSSIHEADEARNRRLNYRIKAPEEERASKWLNEYARNLAHCRVEEHTDRRPPERVEGNVALPRLDLARTLRARLQGDTTGYFERLAWPMGSSGLQCPYCASVFLLQAAPPGLSRSAGFFVNPTKDFYANPQRPSDIVYAAFYWFSAREHMTQGLTESRISMVLRLLPDVVPSTDEHAVATMLAQVPKGKRCRIPIWDEHSLASRFRSPVELAIAGAIRWTMADHILVVGSEATAGISPSVRTFAAEQNVNVIVLRRDDFPPCVLDRYGIDTEMPADTPFSGPPPGLQRFVRPLYGYPKSIEDCPSWAKN